MELKEALTGLEARIDESIKKVNAEVVELGKSSTKTTADLESKLKDHADVLAELRKNFEEVAQKQAAAKVSGDKEGKSIGQQFVESEQFKSMMKGETQKARVEMKNTIVNSGNTVSMHDQLPGVVAGAFRRLTVMPTVQMGATDSNIVYFSRELLFTNNAAGQVEGSAKAESVLTFEEVSVPVRTIAHFLKMSKQAMEDSSFLASYVDRRLRHGINNKVESQIISGDGTGQNLSGWLASGNSTATNPTGTGNIFGLANKMLYEVVASDYEPSYFYFNPADWSTLETTQRGTGDAAYVAGSGAISYVNNGLTPLLWGLPVVTSNNVPAGTIICKSVDADMYAQRSGTVVEMFEQDDTNVQANLITVRAETRGAELNFRPTAIRTGAIASIT